MAEVKKPNKKATDKSKKQSNEKSVNSKKSQEKKPAAKTTSKQTSSASNSTSTSISNSKIAKKKAVKATPAKSTASKSIASSSSSRTVSAKAASAKAASPKAKVAGQKSSAIKSDQKTKTSNKQKPIKTDLEKSEAENKLAEKKFAENKLAEKKFAENKLIEDLEEINRFHKEEYGSKADVVASAPCRFHLMGDHSWFFKDKTLSMAVNLPVYVAASKSSDGFVHVQYVQLSEKKKISYSTIKYKKEDKWANAIKSILYGFGSAGFPLSSYGINLTVYSKVLPSAGFGVTTAIKVATAWAIKELLSLRCSESTLVQVIERGNRYFLLTENHREDTYPAVYSKNGSILLTDHAKNEWENIPFPFKDKTILLTDARVPRIVTWNEESLLQPENVLLLGELKERSTNVYGGWKYQENKTDVNEVLSMVYEDAKRRLMCVMGEHKRILDAVSAIEKKDFASFARAVNHSHESMRDQYDISCPEIDWILKRLQEVEVSSDNVRNPISCGRITGKGFGRCLYTVLPTEDVPKYMEKLTEYERIFGFKPEVYVVKPSSGVHIIV